MYQKKGIEKISQHFFVSAVNFIPFKETSTRILGVSIGSKPRFRIIIMAIAVAELSYTVPKIETQFSICVLQ